MAKTVSQGKDANTFKQLHAIKTFDDGHRDALEELLPEMGLTVTIIACVTDSDTVSPLRRSIGHNIRL